MKVSVVIPLYNKVRHIRRAIDSVLAQSYCDLELIVVDDGSTDGSADIARRCEDPRLRVIVQENAGVSAARNRGVSEAKADCVAFLDADDEWLPCFLETVMDLRARYPNAAMYATSRLYSEHGKSWRPEYMGTPDAPEGGLLEDYFRAGCGPSPVCSSTVMIPKEVLNEVGGFPVGIARGEDLITWARIALHRRVAWAPVVGAICHNYADNRASASSCNKPDVACAPLIEEFLRSGAEPVGSRRYVQEYLVRRRLGLVLEKYLNGNKATALDLMKKTTQTTLFRRRWLFYKLAFLFPPRALRAGIKVKSGLSRIVSGAKR